MRNANVCYNELLLMYLRNEGFIEFDITSIVNSWHQGTSDNYGVVVRATNENVDGTVIKFYSDDSGDPPHYAYVDVTCN